MVENIETLLKHFGKSFAAGEHIFYEGDPGRDLYLVHSGRVRIYRVVKQKERTLSIMREDDFFGEVAALTGSPRSASAVALTETVLIVIPVAIIEKIAESSPDVAIRLVKKMAWRLKATDDLIAILMEGDPQIRIVLGILRLIENEGEEVPEGVALRFSVDDLSSQIEVDPEKVALTISQMAQRGIVEPREEGYILVRNPNELEEFYRFLELSRKFGEKNR